MSGHTPWRKIKHKRGMSHEQFIEALRVQLAIYCDEKDLSVEGGRMLAAELGDALSDCAAYRATYARQHD